MVLKVSVEAPVVLHSRLVLFVLVVLSLVTISFILLIELLIASAFVASTWSILITLLTILAARVVTIILLGWRLSDSLRGTRFDVKSIVV